MTRWVILRTSGGQTLPLMRSLREAGFDVWSPAKPIRRVIKAKTPTGTRLIDTEVPILPTFLFASEADLPKLGDIVADMESGRGCLHPAFSIFRYGGRIPIIGDAEVRGLREEEDRTIAVLQAMRDAESHAEAEKIRIAAMQTETARRRATKELERAQRLALRATRRTFEPGTVIEVAEMDAMVGVAGVVEASDGVHAWVRFGSCSWKIEGWRVSPSDSDTSAALGLAA
jgi:hypothetical protein